MTSHDITAVVGGTHDVLNHLAEYVNVTLRGTSASSSSRGFTPIVLALALITWGGRESGQLLGGGRREEGDSPDLH